MPLMGRLTFKTRALSTVMDDLEGCKDSDCAMRASITGKS